MANDKSVMNSYHVYQQHAIRDGVKNGVKGFHAGQRLTSHITVVHVVLIALLSGASSSHTRGVHHGRVRKTCSGRVSTM